MNDVDYILSKVTDDVLLSQLAEEAAELAHAALKRRRTLTGDNPTRETAEATRAALNEEAGDVLSQLFMLPDLDVDEVISTMESKIKRWAHRLRKINMELPCEQCEDGQRAENCIICPKHNKVMPCTGNCRIATEGM